ncbi:MAG: glycosyltransferase family 1 protein [Acidobacteria bacterium]|nr:MAG: glycosyltransferase family 1 protein [Acidobacteriota bacterium]
MTARKIRVAVDARPLVEPPNGIRRWLEGILGAMPEAAPDIEWVLLVPHEGIAAPEGLQARVVIVPGSMRSLLRPVWETFRLPGALRCSGADALLSPYGMVPVRCPVPTVSVVHDLTFLKWPQLLPLHYRLYWRWMAWTVSRAAAVVVPSKATQRELIDRLGLSEDRITVSPYAADGVFKPAPPGRVDRLQRRFGLPERFVLAVGTLEPRKNLGLLIAAMDRMNADRENPVALVLVGRRGWGDAVADRPWLYHVEGVEDQDLILLYSGAAVFAMPSLDEGFGLPVLEAMACGAPVVVAQAGALPEVVGTAGLVVPFEDVEGWVEALSRVVSDAGIADDMRKKSLERAQDFSWTDSARTVAGILRGIKR